MEAETIIPEQTDSLSSIEKTCENPKCQKLFYTSPNSKKKFCNIDCSARYFALNYYNKVKDKEEYKQKRKDKNRKWIESHRELFNSRMRVYSKNYYHRKKQQNTDAKQQENTTQS